MIPPKYKRKKIINKRAKTHLLHSVCLLVQLKKQIMNILFTKYNSKFKGKIHRFKRRLKIIIRMYNFSGFIYCIIVYTILLNETISDLVNNTCIMHNCVWIKIMKYEMKKKN